MKFHATKKILPERGVEAVKTLIFASEDFLYVLLFPILNDNKWDNA